MHHESPSSLQLVKETPLRVNKHSALLRFLLNLPRFDHEGLTMNSLNQSVNLMKPDLSLLSCPACAPSAAQDAKCVFEIHGKGYHSGFYQVEVTS